MAEEVYLDHNATTPLADEVVKSISESLTEDWANPSSKSKLGLKAHCAIELARERVAGMINAETSRGIVFTSGGTEVLICLFTFSYVYVFRMGDSVTGASNSLVSVLSIPVTSLCEESKLSTERRQSTALSLSIQNVQIDCQKLNFSISFLSGCLQLHYVSPSPLK